MKINKLLSVLLALLLLFTLSACDTELTSSDGGSTSSDTSSTTDTSSAHVNNTSSNTSSIITPPILDEKAIQGLVNNLANKHQRFDNGFYKNAIDCLYSKASTEDTISYAGKTYYALLETFMSSLEDIRSVDTLLTFAEGFMTQNAIDREIWDKLLFLNEGDEWDGITEPPTYIEFDGKLYVSEDCDDCVALQFHENGLNAEYTIISQENYKVTVEMPLYHFELDRQLGTKTFEIVYTEDGYKINHTETKMTISNNGKLSDDEIYQIVKALAPKQLEFENRFIQPEFECDPTFVTDLPGAEGECYQKVTDPRFQTFDDFREYVGSYATQEIVAKLERFFVPYSSERPATYIYHNGNIYFHTNMIAALLEVECDCEDITVLYQDDETFTVAIPLIYPTLYGTRRHDSQAVTFTATQDGYKISSSRYLS